MKKFLLSAALGLAALASTPASAAVEFNFVGGAASPSSGFTVINPFDNDTGITGSDYQILATGGSNGAFPANTIPYGSSYLSVLGGGTATIGLGLASAFQFDWGSVDAYNTLTINTTSGSTIVIPGLSFTNDANGNQTLPGTNGLFTVTGTAGEIFSSITLSSSSNSFEIDNLAIKSAVPEPSTWMMMIFGFGIVGYSLRSRRRFAIQSFS